MKIMGLKGFYRQNYKLLMIIPVVLLIISVILVGNSYIKTGELFNRHISLKGGISATVYTEKDINIIELEEKLSKDLQADISIKSLSDISSKKNIGIIIETSELDIRDELKNSIENNLDVKLNQENYSIEEVGSSLGEGFYKDMIKAVLIAFFLMGIVVFIAFRIWVPSLAVILSAFSDIIITLAIVNIIGINISIAGLAAFLLVIGYSVDTDILMTTKVLKRREGGTTIERLFDSAKTGLTMSATTLVALSVGYIVTSSVVLKEMFLIILIALIVDIISTYLMNAGILMWYKKNEV